MNKLLSDLWNGKVCPKKECTLPEDEEKLNEARLDDLRIIFAKNMDQEELKAFAKYESVNADILEKEKEIAFSKGFSLAIRLLFEESFQKL